MVRADAAEDIYDVLVLGGGLGGMHMLYELRENGFKAVALEAGANTGGAWYWNRYPGARCDVESLVYCYSFSPIIDREWRWSERYAGQKEIRSYLEWVCDRLDLRKDIRFNSRLVEAQYDEENCFWQFRTEGGDRYRARSFVTSPGPLATAIWPDIPGRTQFRGILAHTAKWPQEGIDFTGKRVAVIGTGSSGTQAIPVIADQCDKLTVFMRTANFVAPARNRKLTDEDYAQWERVRDQRRKELRTLERGGAGDIFIDDEVARSRLQPSTAFTQSERQALFNKYWAHGGAMVSGLCSDALVNAEFNEELAGYFRQKVKEIVTDPVRAEILSPKNLAVGTKRIVVGSDFYETFNRDDVDLIDVKKTPIERFTEKGLVIDGVELEFDVIVCASGFDAVTGSLTVIDIRGRGGLPLKDVWDAGPDAYLGLAVHGFPNMFMIGGPQGPGLLSNNAMSNEVNVEILTELFKYMRENNIQEMEADITSQDEWSREVERLVSQTLFATANSWYVGGNVPGKKRAILCYIGGIAQYIQECKQVVENDYRGFNKRIGKQVETSLAETV